MILFGAFVYLLHNAFANRSHGRIPIVTIAIFCLCFAVAANMNFAHALIPSLQDSVFCPYHLVNTLRFPGWFKHHELKKDMIQRVTGNAFHHLDFSHLTSNMASLLHCGTLVEDSLGSVSYAFLIAMSLPVIALFQVVVSYLMLMTVGRDEYHVCSAGLSGVLFALMVISGALTRRESFYHGRQSVFGLFSLTPIQAIVGQAILLTLFDPHVSFAGHMAGFATGYAYLWWTGHTVQHAHSVSSFLNYPSELPNHQNRAASAEPSSSSSTPRRRYVIENGRLRSYPA